MIEVDLKRKIEYKNSHAKKLIDPEKCYKMLEVLKKAGNKYYQFYDDFNIYTERCKENDFKGYTLLVKEEEAELMHDLTDKVERTQKAAGIQEINIEEILVTEHLKEVPVGK